MFHLLTLRDLEDIPGVATEVLEDHPSSMEALEGSYTGPAEEETEEELLDPLSPMSSKRLKVSDINISR